MQLAADGKLNLFFSTDGTAATQLTRASSIVVPAPAQGVPVWLRVTFQGDNGASGNDTKFYYSLDGQQTWIQIGSTVTAAGVQTIFDSNTPTQFVARSGAANATGGAIEYYGFQIYNSLASGARPVVHFNTDQWNGYGSYQVANAPSAQFTDFVGNTVQAVATGATGAVVGAPVLYVLNGAVAGQAIAYANDGTRFPILTPVTSDLAFINFSHNEIGTIDYRAPYKQLADAILAKWPDTGIVATIQNQRKAPAANIAEHAIRSGRIASLAGSQRWAVIDIAGIFAASGNPNTLVQADGIHPEQAGYDLAATKAESIFTQWKVAA